MCTKPTGISMGNSRRLSTISRSCIATGLHHSGEDAQQQGELQRSGYRDGCRVVYRQSGAAGESVLLQGDCANYTESIERPQRRLPNWVAAVLMWRHLQTVVVNVAAVCSAVA